MPKRLAPSALFLADLWPTLDHINDSSLYLAHIGNSEFGIRSYWASAASLTYTGSSELTALAGRLTFKNREAIPKLSRLTRQPLRIFQSLHWRQDPPVNLQTYSLWTLLASVSPKARPRMFSEAKGLLHWHEKFSVLSQTRMPTCVTADVLQAVEFLEAHHKRGVLLKPTNEAASRGVTLLSSVKATARREIRNYFGKSSGHVILQVYDRRIHSLGETRVFLLDGRLVGALQKRPVRELPHVMSLDTGERPELSLIEPTAPQRALALSYGKKLRSAGIMLATLDFIGSSPLELNVTSPGLIKWYDSQQTQRDKIAPKYWKACLRMIRS